MIELMNVRRNVGALALLLTVAASTVAQHGRPARPAAGDGIASLDVFAQGPVLDLLTTERRGSQLELGHQRSTDGGQTWSPLRRIDTSSAPISIASRGNEPQVVAHGDHVLVHWSTTGSTRFGAGPMVTARSSDGGLTWRLGAGPAGSDPADAQTFADMTADVAGVFYVAWIGSHDGPARRGLGVARSTDYGATWEHSQLADDSSCACCWNRMATTPERRVHVLYRDHGVRDMRLATTDEGGSSWTLGGAVGEFDWEFPGCPHVGGGLGWISGSVSGQLVALVWTGHEERHGLYVVRSADDGNSWSSPVRMGGERARHGDLATAGSTAGAVWDESGAIWASRSVAGGEGWGPEMRLSRPESVASHPLVMTTGEGFRVFWTEREDGLLRWRSAEVGYMSATSTSGQN